VPQDLNQTHDREVFHGKQAVTARRLHAGPRHTCKYRVRQALANGLYQTGCKIIAGCLAGNDPDMEWLSLHGYSGKPQRRD
jgi:hypothetical protein